MRRFRIGAKLLHGGLDMLGDCHIHMVLDGVYYRDAIAAHRGHVRDDLIRERLSAYARAGVSFIRDGGDAFGVCLRARQLAGEYGIEYLAPSFPICLKGRYGAFIGRSFETEADYRALLNEVKRDGGDFVKLMLSGIMDFDRYGVITSDPLTARQIRTLITMAHDEGFAVMAHVNGARTVQEAVEAGVDSVEHGAYMDEEALCSLAKSDTVWVPTLSTLGNLIGCGRYPDGILQRILDDQLRNVVRCASLGGRIALGSDAGAYLVHHAQGAQDEWSLMVRALGERAKSILKAGESEIRRRFRRSTP